MKSHSGTLVSSVFTDIFEKQRVAIESDASILSPFVINNESNRTFFSLSSLSLLFRRVPTQKSHVKNDNIKRICEDGLELLRNQRLTRVLQESVCVERRLILKLLGLATSDRSKGSSRHQALIHIFKYIKEVFLRIGTFKCD